MCGIIGIFSYAAPDAIWPEPQRQAMIRAIAHRGPDDQGEQVEPGLFFGHARLAILDLSSQGHQPMSSADGRYLITYNGEIYNFRAIRRELEARGHVFRSQSDTEVLLEAWQAWGEKCLGKLDGIFAFALFDRRERRLYLVRDHFGIKPLFYWYDSQQIVFASELLAMFGPIVPHPAVEAEDLDAYFTFNYLPAPRTGLRGACQLLPGHFLEVDSHGPRLRRYWQLEYQPEPVPLRPASLVERFSELLARAVQDQLVSDAPLGLFLSGGLDSFAVASAVVEAGHLSTAFTLGFDEPAFDESPAAASYADYLRIPNVPRVFSWTTAEIHETLGAMRELLADASCFPIYQLARFARRQATVVLSGDGGDELLAGYSTYLAGDVAPYVRLMPKWSRNAVLGLARYLPSDNQRYGWHMVIERMFLAAAEGAGRDHASFRRIFTDEHKRRLYAPEFLNRVKGFDPLGEYAAHLDQVPRSRSYLAARQHADLMFYLPSVLAKVDRMSMAHGLEVRVPLLNRPLVEFCANLPDAAKWRAGKGKQILREALARRCPAGALKRPKAGFLPPVDQWFRHPGPMQAVLDDYLSQAKTSGVDWLNWDEVTIIREAHRRGEQEAGFVLLGILQFLNWSFKLK
jgi:asparagine synthase (glutamine-hydrolysing)